VTIHQSALQADIQTLGRTVDNTAYYLLLYEANRYMLWGYSGPANRLTTTGQELLANAVSFLISG